jgi:cytochrome c oxidase assembly protein subunit 15
LSRTERSRSIRNGPAGSDSEADSGSRSSGGRKEESAFAFFAVTFYAGRLDDGRESALVMPENEPLRGVYRLAVAASGCTILLLMAGALVTNNDAGDSVPDWPLAYGRLFPPMVGGIRFEYTHRVIAGIVSILMLVLAVWIARTESRPIARHLGWAALGLVIAQAVLGGIRVLVGYPTVSATMHAILAQIFFMTLVGLSLYLSPWWRRDLPALDDFSSPRLPSLATSTTAAVLGQIVLGAAFRHGDFGLTPHLIGAGVVTVLVVWTARAVQTRFRGVRELRRGLLLLHATFAIQISLGFAAWWAMASANQQSQPTLLYVVLTVAHVLGGALTLAASVILMLACFRLIRPAISRAARSEGSPETAGV